MVALYHAEKRPAVTLIKASVVGDKIEGRNTLVAHILYHHVQQPSCNPLSAISFLGVDRADIGRQIL